MKTLPYLFLQTSLVLVLIFQIAYTLDTTGSINDKLSMIDGSSSGEYEQSLRDKKSVRMPNGLGVVPLPYRRHHLKFGVLGKRFNYGYLGKREDEMIHNTDEWLNNIRERRAGRLQYGLLG